MSSIPNIRTIKAIRGESLTIDLGKVLEGTLTAWMKKDPNDLTYRSFEIKENRYLFLTKDKASDYYDISTGELLYPIKGGWFFDVEQVLDDEDPDTVKTIYKGRIFFENDITNSEGVEVYPPNNEGGSVTIAMVETRVSVDWGDDITGEIGNYYKPFKTITAAVVAGRSAIVTNSSLAEKLVINVEPGTYEGEGNIAYAGKINLQTGVYISLPVSTLIDITDAAFSNLAQSNFEIVGNGNLIGINFDHADQSIRQGVSIHCNTIQFDSAVIASEFKLRASKLIATNTAQLYLVDSVHIEIDIVDVEAGVSTVLFEINNATTPGTLDNNSSNIHIGSLDVAPSGRLYLTNFLGTQEQHIMDVKVDSAQGCAIIARGRISGNMTANFLYKANFDNAISAEDHSLFETADNAVINVKANVTNNSYLNRGIRAGARGDSFINLDIKLVSYSSLRAMYIECFDNSSVTLNGTIDAYVTGSQTGIYIYAPYEAPFDNTDNASNLYFQNVTLRNLNTIPGGFGLWCWSGAHHMVNILGTYSLVGLWSAEKESRIDYKYNTILPISAEKTRDLIISTAAQTDFPSMYKLWDSRLNVVMNGLSLQGDDYSISGNDLILGLPAELDDEIVLENFDAEPVIYPMTEWATTGPTSVASVVIPPIEFATPPTDPIVNAILVGPDISGDGVKYTGIPNTEDPTAYLSYSAVQDPDKILQLTSVRFAAKIEDDLDSPAIVKVQASNDNFASFWESPEYEFSTEAYVTKEWWVDARLFSPDKNSSSGINIRVLIFHNATGIAQGILFNNFTLKGYHKI